MGQRLWGQPSEKEKKGRENDTKEWVGGEEGVHLLGLGFLVEKKRAGGNVKPRQGTQIKARQGNFLAHEGVSICV